MWTQKKFKENFEDVPENFVEFLYRESLKIKLWNFGVISEKIRWNFKKCWKMFTTILKIFIIIICKRQEILQNFVRNLKDGEILPKFNRNVEIKIKFF